MGGKVGSAIGLVGGLLAVAGFFLPWLSFTVNLEPLREQLGALFGVVAGQLESVVPASMLVSGFGLLTGGLQGLLSLGAGGQAGVPAPDLGAVSGILTALTAVVALVLVLSILTVVSSGLNLASGRLRAGMIGFGAGTLALSVLLLIGLQMLVGVFYQAAEEFASSIGGGAAGALGLDLGGTLREMFVLSVGAGLYLCVVGGALGIAGGIMGRKREKPAPAPTEAAPAAPAPAAAEEKK